MGRGHPPYCAESTFRANPTASLYPRYMQRVATLRTRVSLLWKWGGIVPASTTPTPFGLSSTESNDVSTTHISVSEMGSELNRPHSRPEMGSVGGRPHSAMLSHWLIDSTQYTR